MVNDACNFAERDQQNENDVDGRPIRLAQGVDRQRQFVE
jgi:hypothetical protein